LLKRIEAGWLQSPWALKPRWLPVR